MLEHDRSRLDVDAKNWRNDFIECAGAHKKAHLMASLGAKLSMPIRFSSRCSSRYSS